VIFNKDDRATCPTERNARARRSGRANARFHGTDDDRQTYERRAAAFRRLRQGLLEVERGAVVDLRNRGVINDEVMSRVQRDIDLEEVRDGG